MMGNWLSAWQCARQDELGKWNSQGWAALAGHTGRLRKSDIAYHRHLLKASHWHLTLPGLTLAPHHKLLSQLVSVSAVFCGSRSALTFHHCL